MAPADPFHQLKGTTFGGIRATQVWADFLLWERLLNHHRALEAIVELGTGEGGFSHYLAAQARIRGLEFATFDIDTPPRRPPGFGAIDIFAQSERVLGVIHGLEPVALFCDDGNKPRELRIFAAQLKHPDSIVVLHDWGSEVGPLDVPVNLRLIHRAYCESLESMSRVFAPAWRWEDFVSSTRERTSSGGVSRGLR